MSVQIAARPTRTSTLPRRALPAAAAVYVAAWATGLLIAPAGPDMSATAGEIAAHFRSNGTAAALQSLLVHGVAGVALAAVATTLGRRLPTTRTARLAVIAALVAVAVSFAQVGFLQVLVATVDSAGVERAAALFHAVNIADSVKLVFLGVFVAATAVAALRAGAMPRWLRSASLALAAALPLSGAAFVFESPGLYALLFVTLPLLLTWVATTALVVSRRS